MSGCPTPTRTESLSMHVSVSLRVPACISVGCSLLHFLPDHNRRTQARCSWMSEQRSSLSMSVALTALCTYPGVRICVWLRTFVCVQVIYICMYGAQNLCMLVYAWRMHTATKNHAYSSKRRGWVLAPASKYSFMYSLSHTQTHSLILTLTLTLTGTSTHT